MSSSPEPKRIDGHLVRMRVGFIGFDLVGAQHMFKDPSSLEFLMPALSICGSRWTGTRAGSPHS